MEQINHHIHPGFINSSSSSSSYNKNDSNDKSSKNNLILFPSNNSDTNNPLHVLPPPSNTSSSSSKPKGATSLLDKYAKLNNAITSARSNITQITSNISTISNEIQTLEHKNKSIHDETTTTMTTTIPSIKNQFKSITHEYDNIVLQKYKESNEELDLVKRSLTVLKKKKEDDRKEFLRSCQEFRVFIRRNRVCLDELLLEDSSLASSSLISHGEHGVDRDITCCNTCDDNDNDHYFRNRTRGNTSKFDSRCHPSSADKDTNQDVTPTATFTNDEFNTKNNIHNDYDNDDTSDGGETANLTNQNANRHDNIHDDDDEGDSMTISTNASTLSTTPNNNNNNNNSTDGRIMRSTRTRMRANKCTVSPVPNRMISSLQHTIKRRRYTNRGNSNGHGGHFQYGKKNGHDYNYSDENDYDEYANDKEINQAKEIMKNSFNISNQTKQNLSQIKYECKVFEGRAISRARQLEQQRSQLDKVRMDVKGLERKIASLEENTLECRQISDAYAKDAGQRRKKLQQASNRTPAGSSSKGATITPISNPYSRNKPNQSHSYSQRSYSASSHQNSMKITNTGNTSSSKSPTTIQNPYKTAKATPHTPRVTTAQDSYRTALAKQHPHRAGRIRVDRQFSTALSVASHLEDYNSDDTSDDDDDGYDSRNGGKAKDKEVEEEENGKKSSSLSSPQEEQCQSCNFSIDGSVSLKRSTIMNLSDDDDDEDDDLLLYIPFDKE